MNKAKLLEAGFTNDSDAILKWAWDKLIFFFDSEEVLIKKLDEYIKKQKEHKK